MKLKSTWAGKMKFVGEVHGHKIQMDSGAPVGDGDGVTPKELLGFAISGCTAMDVVALLKKHKEPLDTLDIEIEINKSEGKTPAVFTDAVVNFLGQGNTSPERFLEVIQLSQTKYCGVSAMLSKAFPISYHVFLNGKKIGSGTSQFS